MKKKRILLFSYTNQKYLPWKKKIISTLTYIKYKSKANPKNNYPSLKKLSSKLKTL
jgi:hypothetical protein